MGDQNFYSKGPHRCCGLIRGPHVGQQLSGIPKLLSNFYSMDVVYICDTGPRNTTCRVAGWNHRRNRGGGGQGGRVCPPPQYFCKL
jgi:hypothetical protein